MFEIFIALFGGIYYGQKYHNEKTILKARKIELINWKEKANSLKEEGKISDLPTTLRYEKYVRNGQNFEDICKKYKEDFEYIFGQNWKKELALNGSPIFDHSKWVVRLILSQMGMLDYDIITGYRLRGSEKYCKECVRFLQRIEKHLLDSGVAEAIFVLKPFNCDGFNPTKKNPIGGTVTIEVLAQSHGIQDYFRLW